MTEAPPRPAGPGLSLTLYISRQTAFLGTAEALVARAGEHAGCASDDARRLGQAVRQALGGLIAHTLADGGHAEIEVAVKGNGRLLKVDVVCPGGAGGTVSVEEALTGRGDDAVMRRLVDRVEFGRDGDRQYCRLTQQVRAAR